MIKTFIVFLFLAVATQHVIKVLFAFHYMKASIMYHHSPGPCIQLSGAEGGSEDLQVLKDGRTFITSGLHKDRRGRILYFDFADPEHKVGELKIEGNINLTNFRPHGLSVWQDPKTGLITLMVVNHDNGDSVEIFQYQEKKTTLKHIKSIRHPMFSMMNDVVAVSEDTFYITKMFHSTTPFRHTVEMYLLMSLGEILYFDGSNMRSVASGLQVPNGINKSPDGKYIYVAQTLAKTVKSYKRLDNNELVPVDEYFVDSTVDNIEVDPKTGDLYIGSHPVFHQIFAHDATMANEGIAPSQVLKFRVKDGKFTDVVEVLLNEGKTITGSTVAYVYKGRLIVGTLGQQLVLCDMKYNE